MAVENDLAELKGIGPKHAATLKEIGVDSIKELRHRNAASLKEMIETRHGKVVGVLTVRQIATERASPLAAMNGTEGLGLLAVILPAADVLETAKQATEKK